MNEKIQKAVDQFFDEQVHKIRGELLFLALHGSHAYGSNHEESDVDLAGVFIAPMEDFLGLKKPQQTVEKQTDEYDFYVHEVGKFFDLTAQGNPNTVEALWGPPLYVHPKFQHIVDQRDDFLSQQFISRCKGFANAQFGRINRKSGKISNHKRNKHAFHIVRLMKMAIQVALEEPTENLIKVTEPGLIRSLISNMDNHELEKYLEVMIAKIDDARYSSDRKHLPDTPDTEVLHRRLVDLRYEIEADATEERTFRLTLEDLA